MAVGGQDGLQPRDRALHELLRELKIEREYEVVPGVAHNVRKFYDQLGEGAFISYRKALAAADRQEAFPEQRKNTVLERPRRWPVKKASPAPCLRVCEVGPRPGRRSAPA
jgi:acetyl esterase/lipase